MRLLTLAPIAALDAYAICQQIRGRRRRDRLSAPVTVRSVEYGTQIICGDCSGDQISPRKTFMDRRGRCDGCGSTSYMLAADRRPRRVDRADETTAVPLRIAS